MAYRDSRDGLIERLSVLETEVTALREDAAAETERERLRAERRDALASAQTRATELEREAAALRAKRPLKANRHDIVKPPEHVILYRWRLMHRGVVLGAAVGASVFVLSDDQVAAAAVALAWVFGVGIYLSGWRGEGL